MTNKESLEQLAQLLNRAYELDPIAIRTLFGVRAYCSESLARETGIETRPGRLPNTTTVTLLALLNGAFPGDHLLIQRIDVDPTTTQNFEEGRFRVIHQEPIIR